MVEEARDVRARGDPEAGLDHAPEHQPEPECTSGVGHPHGLADPAGLRELDVDAVGALGAERDVRERAAVLVDVDRGRRSGASARARRGRRPGAAARSTRARICGSSSSASSKLQYSLTSACSGSSVAARTARTRARSSPSRPPSFSLSRLNPRRVGSLGPSRHVVGIAEPHRPRGRRPLAPQPEQLVTGTPASFPCRS